MILLIVILSEIDSINFLITNIEIFSNIYKKFLYHNCNCVQIKEKCSDVYEILSNIVMRTKEYRS